MAGRHGDVLAEGTARPRRKSQLRDGETGRLATTVEEFAGKLVDLLADVSIAAEKALRTP
jgi:hypothetical protein